MELNLNAKKTIWPKSHYLFLEKVGPFLQTAPQCWQEFHSLINPHLGTLKIKTFTSLYKIFPENIYRAGVFLEEPPLRVIDGLRLEEIESGQYLNYHFKGNFSELLQACGLVFQDLHLKRLEMNENWGIENYLSNPDQTPPDENIVEILIPIN